MITQDNVAEYRATLLRNKLRIAEIKQEIRDLTIELNNLERENSYIGYGIEQAEGK